MRGASQRSRPIWRGSASTLASQPSASRRFARGSDAGSSRENSYTPSPGASTTARLGRLDQRDFERQTGAVSCLLRILAAIIYWQIRGDRSCFERGGLGWPDDLNFELLSHISPIGWDNVLLYGEYQLNRSLVRSERLSV